MSINAHPATRPAEPQDLIADVQWRDESRANGRCSVRHTSHRTAARCARRRVNAYKHLRAVPYLDGQQVALRLVRPDLCAGCEQCAATIAAAAVPGKHDLGRFCLHCDSGFHR